VRIAVASGKGGTGKTTVATSLTYVASLNTQSVIYVDCDVEEPNGHIFMNPQFTDSTPVGTLIPKVDNDKCEHCGKCGKICQFSAIVCMGKTVLVFPELCHGCGGCSLVCPSGAITEVLHKTGKVEVGTAGSVRFVQGLLHIGHAMSPPVIKAVKKAMPQVDLAILDAPPGTSCPVIESVKGCDCLVLVTEPTPFGLNDLKLAVDTIRPMQIPFGVVINRADMGDQETHSYCMANHIKILAEIPDDRKIAEAYSRGEIICKTLPKYQPLFVGLLKDIRDLAGACA